MTEDVGSSAKNPHFTIGAQRGASQGQGHCRPRRRKSGAKSHHVYYVDSQQDRYDRQRTATEVRSNDASIVFECRYESNESCDSSKRLERRVCLDQPRRLGLPPHDVNDDGASRRCTYGDGTANICERVNSERAGQGPTECQGHRDCFDQPRRPGQQHPFNGFVCHRGRDDYERSQTTSDDERKEDAQPTARLGRLERRDCADQPRRPDRLHYFDDDGVSRSFNYGDGTANICERVNSERAGQGPTECHGHRDCFDQPRRPGQQHPFNGFVCQRGRDDYERSQTTSDDEHKADVQSTARLGRLERRDYLDQPRRPDRLHHFNNDGELLVRYERRENKVEDEDLFELEGLSQIAVGRLSSQPLQPDPPHQVSSDERQQDLKLVEKSGVTSSDDFKLNEQQRQRCLISEYQGRFRPLPVGFDRWINDTTTHNN